MLANLTLKNFRNFPTLELKIDPGLTIFYGANSQGKSNLLEAISLLSSLKSFRALADKELVKWGESFAKVKGVAGSSTIEITISEGLKKVAVNSSPKSLLEAWGIFKVVSFIPQEVYLLNSSPEARRKYLDAIISFLDRKYLYLLVEFHKVVKNRNRILFFIKHRQATPEELEVWNDSLVDLGVKIWLKRKEIVLKINEILKTRSQLLFGKNKKLRLEFMPQLPEIKNQDNPRWLKEKFKAALGNMRAKEIDRSLSLLGPHRDNLSFILEEVEKDKVLDKDLIVFGSRGEQKITLLALKMVEIQLIESADHERPTLLLDEVLAELDPSHQDYLFNLVRSNQTIITATSLDIIPKNLRLTATVFKVENGTVLKE